MTRKNYQRFFSIIVILFPILAQYSVGVQGVTLGELTLLGASLGLFCWRKEISLDRSRRYFMYFLIYCYFISIVSLIFQQALGVGVLFRMLRCLFYFTVILFGSEDFDWRGMRKPYQHLSIAIAVYAILQKACFEWRHIMLPNRLLPLHWYADAPGTEQLRENYLKYFFQSNGVFTEPGYLAHYLFPCLVFLLYEKDTRKGVKWFKILTVFLALWFTKSVQAVGLSMGILGLYLLKELLSKKVSERQRGLAFILPMGLFAAGILQSGTGQMLVRKVADSLFAGGSVSVRLLRGYAVFAQLPQIFKWLGVGIGNLDYFVMNHSIRTPFEPVQMTYSVAGYVNGISSVLLYGGIAGAFIFTCFFACLIKDSHGEMRMLAAAYLILSFGEGTIFTNLSIFYFMFIFSGLGKEKENVISCGAEMGCRRLSGISGE